MHRISNVGAEAMPHITTPCVIQFPNPLGRFRRFQLVEFFNVPDSFLEWRNETNVENMGHTGSDNVRAAPH